MAFELDVWGLGVEVDSLNYHNHCLDRAAQSPQKG